MARLVDERLKDILLSDLWGDGWPKIHVTLDVDSQPSTHRVPCDRQRRKPWQPTTTLHDLVRHLRNAAAHGRVTFSSDSQSLKEVKITIEDRPQDSQPVNWKAYMTGEELRECCVKFTELLVDTLG
jgi:HEPN pEK499 p136